MFDGTEGSGVGRGRRDGTQEIEGNWREFHGEKGAQLTLAAMATIRLSRQIWLQKPTRGMYSHLGLWEPPEGCWSVLVIRATRRLHTALLWEWPEACTRNSGYESHEKTFQLTLVMRATRRLLTTPVIRATRILFSQLWFMRATRGL